MGKYFGTDGIRGPVGGDLINADAAYRLGSAMGRYLKARKPELPLNAVIGRDTRASGPELADALIRGLNQHEVYVHDLGVVPTPSIAQSLLEQQADLGIAVTASHNPASDNGIKLFDSRGHKYDAVEEAQIEALMDAEPPAPAGLPKVKSYRLDAAAFYVNYVRSLMDQNCLSGWKIVLDLANGATSETTPAAFKRWGAELILIGNQPDGENINQGVGSEHPELLGEAVVKHGANLGIAHDGDGDRVVVCDETGVAVDGDILLGLFGLYALRSGALGNNTLVATVQSNLGLDLAMREAGGRVERTDIGDRNVARVMREIGSNIGGESSGHIIFSDFATTGDGLLAAVKLIGVMCHAKKPLSELRQEIRLFPQGTLNLKVAEKKPLDTLDTLNKAIAAVEKDFGEDGRVLVRYSGTEPKLRLLVEGKDEKRVSNALKDLEKAACSDLDVIAH
ncbi:MULTISPECIES: phosphoglucosamine mutase [unclassified Lentimonas]|uniref:phosphoglucosamine mutase n=1 Tax=unclassified Lentimonas TaxID=2630993 RepID=UPI00132A58FF|nr:MULTISPECIES: phosphoglucosamine mutase [unclassified Lentimonas]CAA6676827.1 Phosphoglucosamine mutase (EC [Lentimonas sp. CC4]CAA6686634.1 Phosphoglucosamine mutase (EC [Lentimonas sp. CC6]CAA7075789.1 Phosphoglucosamine mutase (EC [Lentimonas sp. CC4]CAA7168049.1 Phosphoglucosamine mutase (EC [Lentimonas sp. CC21]CAA7183008.1 Phosphoglucosamine mutase (EC [Lentimonas sp. CC8]